MGDTTPEGKLLNLIKQAQSQPKLHKDIKLFTKLVIGLSILIGVILIVFMVDIFTFDKGVSSDFNIESLGDIEEVAINDEDISEYENIEPLEVKENIIPKEALIADLRLLGIVTGDSNQAIIEDKNTKESFFLNKGDKFKDLVVFDIKKDSVVFEYRGEKIDLNM